MKKQQGCHLQTDCPDFAEGGFSPTYCRLSTTDVTADLVLMFVCKGRLLSCLCVQTVPPTSSLLCLTHAHTHARARAPTQAGHRHIYTCMHLYIHTHACI